MWLTILPGEAMPTPRSKMTPEQKVKANTRNKRWKDKNREKVLEYKRKHYAENKDKYMTIERDRAYRKRYGICLEEYNEMLKSQGGKCAICGSETAGKMGQHFAVDHCHSTLRVRGLLCIKCNARLGWYEAHKNSVKEYLK
jgi:hypothetical protein